MPIKPLRTCFLLCVLLVLTLHGRPVHSQEPKATPPSPSSTKTLDSSLLEDWLGVVKSENGIHWVEKTAVLNARYRSPQLEERASKEFYEREFPNWTKLSQPRAVKLVADSGETVVAWANEFSRVDGCDENAKLKLDFSNLPGLEKKKWALAVVGKSIFSYEVKKQNADKGRLKILITSGPHSEKITATFDGKAQTIVLSREETLHLLEDCD